MSELKEIVGLEKSLHDNVEFMEMFNRFSILCNMDEFKLIIGPHWIDFLMGLYDLSLSVSDDRDNTLNKFGNFTYNRHTGCFSFKTTYTRGLLIDDNFTILDTEITNDTMLKAIDYIINVYKGLYDIKLISFDSKTTETVNDAYLTVTYILKIVPISSSGSTQDRFDLLNTLHKIRGEETLLERWQYIYNE